MAFATLANERASAVIVSAGPFYPSRAGQLAGLAAAFRSNTIGAAGDPGGRRTAQLRQ